MTDDLIRTLLRMIAAISFGVWQHSFTAGIMLMAVLQLFTLRLIRESK